jgi:ABC-2 type transport system ATP-binding protein
VGGFVETPRFYPYLSARRNLEVLARLDGGDATTLIDDALARVGLPAGGRAARQASAGRQKVRGYSLGMRQRLGLAAAMLRRPRLLILDEPANGMDPAGIRDLRAALRRAARDGVTVVLSSHDMTQVEEICDSVTILHHGTVAAAGPAGALRADAPDPVWRLRTSDDAKALTLAIGQPRAEQVKAEQVEARQVKAEAHEEGGLVVHGAAERMDRYVLALGAAGIAVRGLELSVTPLEALFFQVTAS